MRGSTEVPCGGRNAAARTITRTRDVPNSRPRQGRSRRRASARRPPSHFVPRYRHRRSPNRHRHLSMPSPSCADNEHPAATSATDVLAQPFPIARSYLLAVPFTDLGPFEESAAASVGNNDIGVIAGEHDAVGTDDVECPLQVALAEYSSWRDEDVAANILRHRAAQIGDAGHPVDAFEVEQHHFAPMPQDQLQTGKPVSTPPKMSRSN